MYKTTPEENEVLSRVGIGTPMGKLLRHYWWPVGFSDALKDKPTFIRVLGEDLVLFRDGKGNPGVLAAQCSHRRANLCLGSTEKEGLRCRYHGWLYDVTGKVLQTPGESSASNLKDTVKHLSYDVEELGGLVFTYLGPKPAPLLPRFHFLAAEGERDVLIQSFNDCNWLQCVENGIDPYHVSFLHGNVWAPMAKEPEKIWFDETEWGCVYKAIRPGRKDGEFNYREHAIIMPNIASGGQADVSAGEELLDSKLPSVTCRWSVPVDDTHTMNLRIFFRSFHSNKTKPTRFAGLQPPNGVAKAIPIEPYKEYREAEIPTLGYRLPDTVNEEDATMLDGLGPIVDRENENLSVVDGGIILLRNLYLKQIDLVKAGKDPKGVIRKAADNQMIVAGGVYKWITLKEKEALDQIASVGP